MSDMHALRNQEMLTKIWLRRLKKKRPLEDAYVIGLLVLRRVLRRGCGYVMWINLAWDNERWLDFVAP
jgi:hypothetical protein